MGRQIKATFKKEFLELIRHKKLHLYIGLAFSYILINVMLQKIFQVKLSSNSMELSAGASWYLSQVSANTYLLGLYFLAMLLINRKVVVRELMGKKLAVPLFMGLKPSVNISVKYIVQAGVPAVIAGLASLFNAVLSMLLLNNEPIVMPEMGVLYVTFGDMALSSLCVFFTILASLLFMFSLTALFRNHAVGLVMTLIMEIWGNHSIYSLNVMQSFANTLVKGNLHNSAMITTMISTALLIMLVIASILVYTDRNDFTLRMDL